MATITTVDNPVSANLPVASLLNNKTPKVIWQEVDLAAAVAAKGSALAAADVIEALTINKDTVVLDVWAKKSAAMTGTSADLTFDIGITGADPDQWVDGWDFDAAAVGSYATPTGVGLSRVVTNADSIDILIATQTGTVLTGKVIVYALILDLSTQARGVIAQPKS